MIECTVLDLVIFIGFIPCVILICWMIWNEEKLIAFENKFCRTVKIIFCAIRDAWRQSKHENALER